MRNERVSRPPGHPCHFLDQRDVDIARDEEQLELNPTRGEGARSTDVNDVADINSHFITVHEPQITRKTHHRIVDPGVSKRVHVNGRVLDDGNLATGGFQKLPGVERYYYIIEG